MSLTVTLVAGGVELMRDRSVHVLSAARLRAACRCASCTARMRKGELLDVPTDIEVLELVPVGGYGAQLKFTDGHERGIYPWSYLEQLSDG